MGASTFGDNPIAKITPLTDVSSGYASANTTNNNNQKIEDAFANTLSRDGSSPNTMLANLDMNSKKIVNLAAPVNPGDAARLADVVGSLVLTDATIPALSGHSGDYLSNNGTALTWADPVTPTVLALSPLDYGCVGDGVTDDVVNFQACIDAASALGVALGGIVEINGSGKAYRVVSAPLQAKSNVRIRNLTGLFSTVAASTVGSYNVYAWIVGAGTISANITTLQARNVKDSMTCSVAGTGLAAGDLVVIGHDGPVTTLSGAINASATTITVGSTTGFPSAGYLYIDQELIAYRAKTATTFTVRASTGRGRNLSTAASHDSGTKVFAFNQASWGIARNSARLPALANYVQEVRANTGGGYDVLMRHSIDRIFSVTNTTSWIKRVTPIKNFELVDCTLTGSTSIGRASGLEYGYNFRLCENVQVRNCRITNCSDAHGVFDQCFNFLVENQDCFGKADDSDYDGHYALMINNGCHWGQVNNIRARNCYKAVTIHSSGYSTGLTHMGFPRYITVDGAQLFNGGTPWDNAHDMIELHTYGEHITFRNCGGADASGGMSHEGGRNIVFENCNFSNGAIYGVSCDGVFVLHDFVCRNVTTGRRTKLAAGTRLNGAINDVVTTIVLDNNTWITDAQNDFTAVVLKIDDELIQLGYSTTDYATFTTCIRGAYGTTAASHADNATVDAWGSGYAIPLSFDLTSAKMFLDDPDVAPTYLSGAVLVGDTTIAVAETSQFSSTGGFAEIEGETLVSGEYPSEIIYYAGKSTSSGAGNLTGCVRAQFNTDATAHSQYFIIQPFTPALSSIELTNLTAETDFIRAPLSIEGYNPVVNGTITGVNLKYTDDLRFNTYGALIEPHGFVISGGMITDLNYGWRFLGNGITGIGLSGRVNLADTTGGHLVYVDGDRCNVLNCFADGFYYTARLAGNYGTINNCTGQRITYATTNGCYESGTGNSMNGNIRIA